MSVVKVFLRTPYNYDVDKASDETAVRCEDATKAVQESRDECDINTIVRRFGLTGVLPIGLKAPQYGDFEGVFDFQSALNAVLAAEDAFMQMPPDIRYRFHNDPQAFLEFCSKAENRDEAVKMGLVVDKTPVASLSDGVKGEGAPPVKA